MRRAERVDYPMIAVVVRDQGTDANDRVIDVFQEFVAHRFADFLGSLVE